MKSTTPAILALCGSIALTSVVTLNPPQSQTVPAGTIVAFGGLRVPPGWILCDGRAMDKDALANRSLFNAILTFHGNGTSGTGANPQTDFNVPDYRGRFLRGVDGAARRDVDAPDRNPAAAGGAGGNHVGSVQSDELKSHNHSNHSSEHGGAIVASPRKFLAGGNINHATTNDAILTTGGSETRPKNAYVQFIIKL